MCEVAEAYDVEVIDAASVLEGIPGVFVDVCHFNEEGHQKVGELLAERISKLLAKESPIAGSPLQKTSDRKEN
jgi:hypothetical protein